MDKLAIQLALNGSMVLFLSLVAGMFLYLSIRDGKDQAAWHLLHAGGAARGVMLLALAAILRLPELPFWLLSTAAWAVIFFVWTSMLAMGIRAITGDRGLRLEGSFANRIVYISYALGTVAIFPALAILIYGLARAL